jgi:catechol 2,3-dioxygenase-like lactoylglutathione lyase family enzyme
MVWHGAAMLNYFRIVAFLTTTDYARARAFYVDKLGLEFIREDQFAMVLRANENMVRVVKAQQLVPVTGTVLGWEVSDIARVVRELESRGIIFEKYPWVKDNRGLGIWTTPNGDQVAWFKDPDGNVLSVSEHK